MEQLDLSDFFRTKTEANDFSMRLSTIIEKMYQTDFNFEMAFMDQFGIKKRDKFITLLRENKINIESNSDLQEFLNSIQQKISSLPVVSLTLAIEPKEETLFILSHWFFININKQVLFDIDVDPDLIAGAAITINGKHMDFSIKSTFNQILQNILTNKTSPPAPRVDKPVTPPDGHHQSIEHISFGR